MKPVCFLILLLTSCLLGCTDYQIMPSPPPPMQVFMGVTPSLSLQYRGELFKCERDVSDLAILLEITPLKFLDAKMYDANIRLGESGLESTEYAYLIGWEEIVFIANPVNNFENLDFSSIVKDYSSTNPTHILWAFPEGSELQLLFQQFTQITEPTPYSLIAPDSGEMLKAVEENENSIGYIPKSWITEKSQVTTLESLQPEGTRVPIVLQTKQKPQEKLARFIECLQ